jgi:8-oxo-dGTP diphosphatase
MKKAVVVGVLVRNDKGQYLLVKKPPGIGPYAGTYLIPGGHVDEDEPIDKAALRELYEETGVRVKDLKRSYFGDDFTQNWKGNIVHFIYLLYTAKYVSGNLQPTEGDDDNLAEIRWFSTQEIVSLDLSPPLRNLFQVLKIL